MKALFYVLSAMSVMALALWAYQQNYRTQQSLAEVDRLNRDIGEARAAIAVLRAEWAYLNRPDRLRELALLNFDSLGLVPLAPTQFARVDQIAFPREEVEALPTSPIDELAPVLTRSEPWP